jgi:glutathione S-transferase
MINTQPSVSDEASRKILFGQTAASRLMRPTMTIKLFDLAGAEPDLRFSPYCWRTKLALAHKGLAAETIPWRFVEKDAIAMSGQGRVPVLLDGDKVISDSWAIAEYLEDTYPDRPSLFGGEEARRVTRFINCWADTVVNGGLVRMLLTDIYALLHEKDQPYFRESREKRFGMPLEEVSADRDTRIAEFRQSLEPARSALTAQPYLAGGKPLYADYILFGCFMWARSISSFRLLTSDDPIYSWRERMLDAMGGLARTVPGHIN